MPFQNKINHPAHTQLSQKKPHVPHEISMSDVIDAEILLPSEIKLKHIYKATQY